MSTMWRWFFMAIVLSTFCTRASAQSAVLLPDGEKAAITQTPTSAQARLKDGTILLGVNLRWYIAAKPDPQPISDEDRSEITELLTVASFYDRAVLLHLEGDGQRAVGLMELIRDRDFHAGKGEVIWRAEVWYFEFQNGGWAKVSQQNKLLDRQRFKSADDYASYVKKLRFVPKLTPSAASTQPAILELLPADIIKPSLLR